MNRFVAISIGVLLGFFVVTSIDGLYKIKLLQKQVNSQQEVIKNNTDQINLLLTSKSEQATKNQEYEKAMLILARAIKNNTKSIVLLDRIQKQMKFKY